MTKKFKGFRFSPDLYEEFKALAQNSGLMVTEAFEKFMRACVEVGAVKFPESPAHKREVEAEARVLLTWLRRKKEWYQLDNEEKSFSVQGRLLHLLPRIEDDELRNEVETELKKRPPS
ncbi:hypothetical protein MUO79_07635 [Candidatus Bathyarchaeota archaeon]|nr:hypothetical protein [Candidatus Bathyarchaeota archaeon]